MRVQSLEIKNYRNISDLTLHCPEELILFVGPNAQGKTNILESLYVLALGKSHRTRNHRELIQFGKNAARIKTKVIKDEQTLRLEIDLNGKGKIVKRNGIEQSRLSQYIGSLPAVLFAPEDLAIVKGSPQVRRRFLDMEIGQVSPSYIYHLTQLNKCISQRNHLLKQLSKSKLNHFTLLEVMDDQLISLSIQIWKKRFYFLDLLRTWAKKVHYSITQNHEDLLITYIPSAPIEEKMDVKSIESTIRTELEKVREKELARGTTVIGPHRDDLRLKIAELDLHLFGSQGQQRTAALSLKLAELELIKQEIGHYPILLLDDVLSELDDTRKTQLLDSIQGRVQTFVTMTSLDGVRSETLNRAQIYQVRQGSVEVL